jgi:hypothetical protein
MTVLGAVPAAMPLFSTQKGRKNGSVAYRRRSSRVIGLHVIAVDVRIRDIDVSFAAAKAYLPPPLYELRFDAFEVREYQ